MNFARNFTSTSLTTANYIHVLAQEAKNGTTLWNNETLKETFDIRSFRLWMDGIIKIVVAVYGFVLNSLAMMTLITNGRTQNIFHQILVTNLVTDNMYLFISTLGTMFYVFKVKWLICIIPYVVLPLQDIIITANILITICLSHERYKLMCNRHTYIQDMSISRNRYLRLLKYLSIVVLFSVSYNIPRFFAWQLSEDGTMLEKTTMRENYYYEIYYKGWRWIVLMVVSFTIVIWLNLKIFFKFTEAVGRRTKRKAMKRMVSLEKEQNRIALNMLKRRDKLTSILFALVIVFLFCNTWRLIEEACDAFHETGAWVQYFEVVTRLIVTLHCSCNVFVYGIMNRQFMNECKAAVKHLYALVTCGDVGKCTSDGQ